MEYLMLDGDWTENEADAVPMSEEDAKVFKRTLQKAQNDGLKHFEFDYISSDD